MSAYPEPAVRYLIAGPTRSGTTAVHLLLAGHPAVSVFAGELAPAAFIEGLARFSLKGYLTDAERERGHRLLFDALTGAEAGPETVARGMKTCMNSPAMVRRMARVLRERLPGTRVIVTCRRDYVAHLGSRLHLQRTGVAHSWRRGSEAAPRRIRVSRMRLVRHVVAMERVYAAYRELAAPQALFWLEYERFAADNEAVYRELVEFLGLPLVEPRWMHSRKVLPAPERYIEHYAELRRYAERIAASHRAGRLSPAFLRLAGLAARLDRLGGRRRARP